MTIIREIKPTRQGRYALFSEHGFLFSLDGDTLADYGLESGTALDDADMALLHERSEAGKARATALRYLAARAHAAKELSAKLRRRFDDDTVNALLEVLAAEGLIDDDAYAREKALALARRGKGPHEIRRYLRNVGIEADLAQAVVAALPVDTAAQAADITRRYYLDKLAAGKREQVMAALARRGFAHRDIKAALAAVEDELSDFANAGREYL